MFTRDGKIFKIKSLTMLEIYDLKQDGNKLIKGDDGITRTAREHYDKLFTDARAEKRVLYPGGRVIDGMSITITDRTDQPELALDAQFVDTESICLLTDPNLEYSSELHDSAESIPVHTGDLIVTVKPTKNANEKQNTPQRGGLVVNQLVEEDDGNLGIRTILSLDSEIIYSWPTEDNLSTLLRNVDKALAESEVTTNNDIRTSIFQSIGRIQFELLYKSVASSNNDLVFLQSATDLNQEKAGKREGAYPGFADLPAARLLTLLQLLDSTVLGRYLRQDTTMEIPDDIRDRIDFARGFVAQDRVDQSAEATAILRKASTNNHMEVISNSRLANHAHNPDQLIDGEPLKAAA